MKARDLFEHGAAPTEAPPKPGVKPTTKPRPTETPRKHPNPFRRRDIRPDEAPRPKAAYGMDQTYTESEAPRPRKIKYNSHKNFGNYSRMVDGKYVKPEDAGGRSVGSKQVYPGDYPDRTKQGRSRAEKRNAAERADESKARHIVDALLR